MTGRLENFMQANGFTTGSNSLFYRKFHEWSISDREGFYKKALEDIKFPWIKTPTRILEHKDGDPIWKAKWFIGGEANVYDVCIDAQVRRGLGGTTTAIFYREDGKTSILTFTEAKEKIELIASRLKGDGIKKGDRISIIMPSCEYSYLLFYAVQKIGATFVPIPAEVMGNALSKRLAMTKPKMIFYLDNIPYNKKVLSSRANIIPVLNEVMKKEGHIPKLIEIKYIENNDLTTNDLGDNILEYEPWLKGSRSNAKTEPLSNNDITMILFTSGTTGTPKGTMHTYASLIEDMLENAYSSDVKQGERFMWFTSPGWMMFPWLVMGVNGLGATVVLYDGSPKVEGSETLLKCVEKFKINHLGVSPPLIMDIVETLEKPGFKKKIPSLRQIRYTSSPLAESLAGKLSGFGYPPNGACGGTDACFCYCGCNSLTKRKGAAMLPSLGIDVHVMVRKGREWHDAKPDEIGEIVIKSPFMSMTNGLLNDDPERTLFRSTYFRHKRDDESVYWFHGDLASFDKDGYLTIHGRADDLIVVHGCKLSPSDVQDAVLHYNPEVRDSAAISLPIKEGDGGELLLFVIVDSQLKNIRDGHLTKLEERIKNSVKNKVNKLAKPYKVFFVDSIPYTINNKPALRIIKNAFTNKEIGDTSTIRNKESIDEIMLLSSKFNKMV